jgi:hypothetical protein
MSIFTLLTAMSLLQSVLGWPVVGMAALLWAVQVATRARSMRVF